MQRSLAEPVLPFQNNYDYVANVNNIKEKRGRGRPRKVYIEMNNEVEILVSKVIINGEVYLRTKEGVLLDKNSYEVVDINE